MSSAIAKKRTNNIVAGDQWLAFLAKNNVGASEEKTVQELTNTPEETVAECWYENHARHCSYLIAVDHMAQLCDKAAVNVPNEETLWNLTFHKELWNGCKTEEEAIERLQTIAKRFHWQ